MRMKIKDYNNKKNKTRITWKGRETAGMNRLAPKQAVQKHWFYCKTSQSLLVIQKVAMAASWGYACGGREKK